MDTPEGPLVDQLARHAVTLRHPPLIAVGGADGSGKTTFAAHLAAAIEEAGRPAFVVHEDDFLAPRAVRYRLGRDSPEGYFQDSYDLAALIEHVLAPLAPGGERWDWSSFLDVPFTETVRRMAERDGSHPDPEHPSMRRYAEGQRIYLSSCRPQDRATHVVDNS